MNGKMPPAPLDIGTHHRDEGPHAWWRQYPADQIAPAAEMVAAELDRLSAINPDLRRALRGDLPAAVRLAITISGSSPPFPIASDLAMTALMGKALKKSLAAAVVMAHVIKHCRFDHDRGPWLSGSWSALALKTRSNPDSPSGSTPRTGADRRGNSASPEKVR